MTQSSVMGKDIHASRKRAEVAFSDQTKYTLSQKWLEDQKSHYIRGSIHP